jgi:hypothetical protein
MQESSAFPLFEHLFVAFKMISVVFLLISKAKAGIVKLGRMRFGGHL